MRHLKAFASFWYDFIVGDDWRVALGVVVAIGATAPLSQGDDSAWWLMPVAIVALVYGSLRRATRAR
jgi:hydrogenase/urease accessory protein HupE